MNEMRRNHSDHQNPYKHYLPVGDPPILAVREYHIYLDLIRKAFLRSSLIHRDMHSALPEVLRSGL